MRPLSDYDFVNSLPDQLMLFFTSLIFWSTFYWLVNSSFTFKTLRKRDQDDVKNRIVSIAHGLFTFLATFYHLKNQDPQFGASNTSFQLFILISSLSYFFYDTVACIYYGIYDTGLILHHSMVLLGYGSAILQQYGATEALSGLFFAEVSNFPMHVRAILKTLGLRYTRLYECLELIYMSTYIIARGVFIPIEVVYNCVSAEMCPLIVKFICCGLAGQSWYYILEMQKILKRKLSQLKERNKKNISYCWLSVNPKLKELSYINTAVRENVF